MEMTIRPMTASERMYCYSQSQQIMAQTGCIGHLRGDMGSSGEQFFSSWDDHQGQLKTQEFKDEFDEVINALRFDEAHGGVLASRRALANYCWDHPDSRMVPGEDDFGFRLDTENYSYLLRLNPNRGMYNIYCYCYQREWLDNHLQNAAKGIRFIDSHYNEKFRVPDGEKVRIITAGGEHRDMRVRYIDDYHIETNADWGNTLYHICEFAERFEERGCQDIFPLRSTLPDRCYSILESTGDIIIIQKGEKGYYHIDVTEGTKAENRAFVDSQNAKLGITKAQEEAMKAGSMFGWAVPAADPQNYDDKGAFHFAGLELYKKALAIAPDFYDAYNNMAGIYGSQGRYQEAYAHFLKAHEINPVRPNPIYGLALCCRDLGRTEECIKWCEEYSHRSTDNRLADLYEEMKAKVGGQTEEACNVEGNDYEVIKAGDEWSMVMKEGCYFFIDEYEEYATTPRGVALKTSYLDLAERILEDLDTYGPDDFSPDSILPWHYTMVENFSKMQHKQVEAVLADSFVNRYDWTYTVDMEGTKWETIWGKRGVRETEIMAWLSKITHMQMTAACCIGNAYHTINVAYMLATIMEDYTGVEREAMFEELADVVGENSEFFASVDDFRNFELYYGIHLNENGKVIHQ